MYNNLPFTFTTSRKRLQHLLWGIRQISLSFTCSMVMILHSAHIRAHCPIRSLSKCPSQGLTLLPWANSYLIQKQGSLCPAASRAPEIAAQWMISDRQNSNTIHWLLTWVDGCNLGFQIISVIKKTVSVKLCWNPSLYVGYHLHSHHGQINDDSVCLHLKPSALVSQWQRHVWVWYHQPRCRQLAGVSSGGAWIN